MSEPITRRGILTTALPAIVLAAASSRVFAQAGPAGGLLPALGAGFSGGEYVLPPLPYAYDALEPHIDKETMTLHHDKHHKAYVDGLNKTLAALVELRAGPGPINNTLLTGLEEDLSFNGSGHVLHTLFWSMMAPNAGGDPTGLVGGAITKEFGSTEAFKTHFAHAAAAVKGSGWACLAYEPLSDSLMILQLKQHDLQSFAGAVPLLPLDVWEHAYYLKYRNVRADYVKAWWNVVNWPAVNDAYTAARTAYGRA